MSECNFIPLPYSHSIDTGSITWKAPSNIALIKYWGKHQGQIPANPSISFTLSRCTTTTTLSYEKRSKKTATFSFDLFFEGKAKEIFIPKMTTFFKRIEPYLPFLNAYHFTIRTSNSFPHSSGIASSASSMSALALCLMDMEKRLNPKMDTSFFNKKASFIARLGSGSACRSIKGNLVIWGYHPGLQGTSNAYGIPYPYELHPVFDTFQDTILLVDSGQKQVSSSEGHRLMHHHPFALKRFEQASENLLALQTIFREGNIKAFIPIVEQEALTLHAMMMTSRPYFILMKPNTLNIINAIWAFRKKTNLHLCFTLDAGANVHVLYPEEEKIMVMAFIRQELAVYCENERYICDKVGFGAEKL